MSKEITIAVIGSINADLIAYKSMVTQRANYAYGSNFEMNLGGKSLNVALTFSALSVDVALIARVGNDIFGLDILGNLVKRGLVTQYIKIEKEAHTGIGHVRVDKNGQYNTIVVNGANWKLNERDIDVFINDGHRPGYVVFNFETSVNLLKRVIPKFKSLGSKIVVNFSPVVNDMRDLFAVADVAVLNLEEAQQILDSKATDPKRLLEELKKLGPETIVITLGSDGAASLDSDGSLIQVPAQVAQVKNTIGAGDGFLACLVYSIALGLDISQSMVNATHVGKLICSKKDASLNQEDVLVLNSETTFVRSATKPETVKG